MPEARRCLRQSPSIFPRALPRQGIEDLCNMVQPLRRFAQPKLRLPEKFAARQPRQPAALLLDRPLRLPPELGHHIPQPPPEFGAIGHQQFRRGTGRRRAEVGNKVGDRKINLVPDR